MEDLNYEKIKQLLSDTDPDNQELGLHLLKGLGLKDDVELLCLMTDRVEKLYWCIQYEWLEKLGEYPKAIKNVLEVVNTHIQTYFRLDKADSLLELLAVSPFLKFVEKLKQKTDFKEDGLDEDKLPFYLTHQWREKFGKIKRLDLTNTKIPSAYLEQLDDFYALEYLSFYNTNLSVLPEAIANLKNLKKLELGKNPELEDYSLLKHLTKIRILGLGYNQLKMIPPSVLELYELEEINLRSNQIRFLPKGFYNLKALRILNFKRNQLSQISPELGGFNKLEELLLQKNHLSDLPEVLWQMPQLKKIDLRSNPVIQLHSDKIEDLKVRLANCKMKI